MPTKPIIIRAKHTDGVTTVRALITHPMTKPQSRTASAKEIQSHFIQEVNCYLGDQTILTAHWGSDVAKDPLLAFTFKGGNKGEVIRLSWVDNRGERDSIEATIG